MSKRLLLLSNSRNAGHEFLEHAVDPIRQWMGDTVKRAAFVPYAGVTLPFDPYTKLVREHFEGLGLAIESVHETDDPAAAINRADAVMVGGGNTFHLLYQMVENGLLDVIRERVANGAPYMGWSAGANLACPTMKTTNDMPIIEPAHFDALGLVPFQINPHYLDADPEGHAGETREQRILEFLEVNPNIHVLGLREGTMLSVDGSSMELIGAKPMRVFKKGLDPTEHAPGDVSDFLVG